MLAVPVLLLIVATIFDLRSRIIPDWISVALIVWGGGAATVVGTSAGWSAFVLGMLLGLVLGMPLFLLGGFGGGDVKLLVGLGAILGPLGLLNVLFWMALAGGVLAIAAKLRGRHDLAYVPAIAIGLVIYTVRHGEVLV